MRRVPVAWLSAGVVPLALLLQVLLPARQVLAAEAPPPAPSLVLVTVSSLRGDRVQPGLSRGTLMPHFLSMGQRGALLPMARTPVPETIPALASLFTGMDRGHHGVYGDNQALAGVTSLAERLAARGYSNSAWLGDPDVAATPFLTRGVADVHTLAGESDTAVATAVVDAVAGHVALGKQFVWVHLAGVSAPYIPTVADLLDIRAAGRNKSWRFPLAVSSRAGTPHMLPAAAVNGSMRDAAFYRDAYDAMVKNLDRAIATLETGLAKPLTEAGGYMVVASLHGESLGEHGQWFSHGHTLYEEELLAPIFLLGPDIKPLAETMWQSWASLNDLAPTLAMLLGLDTARGRVGDGFNLAPLLRGSSAPPKRFLPAGLERPPYSQALLVEGRFKLILTPPRPTTAEADPAWPPAGGRELYDLNGDRLESGNIAVERGGYSHEYTVYLRRNYPPWSKTPPGKDSRRRR